MSRSRKQLLQDSNQVKEEIKQGANTADRIGGLLHDIAEHIGEGGGGSGDSVEVIRDLNEGTPIAKIRVNEKVTQLYAPEGGDGGGGDEPGYQKVYFANVASGSTPQAPSPSEYDSNTDSFPNSTPKWVRTNVNPSENENTFAIWVYFNAEGNIVTIDGPVKINGAGGGTNGEDGEEIEWIYFRIQNELTVAEISTIQNYLETCKGNIAAHKWNGSSWENCTFEDADAVPLNGSWVDNAQGIDETYKYEYAAFRRSTNGADGKRIWGVDNFHGPLLWSAYGKQGLDGDGIEYIFYANATGNFPTDTNINPENWTNDEHFQDSEYIRANTGWMDDPIDLSQSGLGQGAVEWVSVRKKKTVTIDGKQVAQWQAYSAPAVWTRLAKDGGAPKEVDHTELYFKAVPTHVTPSQGADTAPSEWHLGEDPTWGSVNPHLYCQEKTIYKDNDFSWGNIYYKGQWIEGGGTPQKGDSGYTLIIEPSYAIFEDKVTRVLDSSGVFDHYDVTLIDSTTLNAWTGHVQLLQDSTPQTIGFADGSGQTPPSTGIINGDNCTFKVTVTDGTGSDPKGLKIKVQSITNPQTTEGKMRFWVTLNNALYCLVEIPIYLNRLGTHFQYIVGDSETTIMKKTVFTDIDGTIYKFNNIGEYLRSSSENISTIRQKVNDGKNILPYLTRNWCSAPADGSTSSPGRKDTILYGDKFSIEDKSGSNDMYSPPVLLQPNTDYCFSAYFDFDPRSDLVGYLVTPNSYSDGWEAYNANPTQVSPNSAASWIVSNDRYAFTFKTGNTAQMFFINLFRSGTNKLYRPQLELGTTPSLFEASSYELSSQISQTATEIRTTVIGIQKQIDAIQLAKVETIDATSLDESKCYPVVIDFKHYNGSELIRCKVERTLISSYGVPSYGIHDNGFVVNLDWTTKASGWGANLVDANWSLNDKSRFIHDYYRNWTNPNDNTIPLVGSIGQITEVSQEIVYVRGGSKYDIATSFGDANIELHPSGYNWSQEGSDGHTYTESRPVINASDLVIPRKDTMNYSEIIQTANNIQLNVYDELKNKTGIDVSNGKITLNADDTDIIGNLNLDDTGHGLTLYDSRRDDVNDVDYRIPTVNLQPKNVDAYSTIAARDFFDWLRYNSSGSASTSSDSSYRYFRYQLNFVYANNSSLYIYLHDKITIGHSSCMAYVDTSTSVGTPYFMIEAVNITTNKTYKITGNGYNYMSYNSTLNYKSSTVFQWVAPEAGTYQFWVTVRISASSIGTKAWKGNFNTSLKRGGNIQTFIGNDGFYTHNDAFSAIYAGKGEARLQSGLGGIRVKDANSYDGNLPVAPRIEVGTVYAGSFPGSVKPLWIPIWNFTPINEIGAFDYSLKTVYFDNSSYSKYVYDVPVNINGILHLSVRPMDSAGNLQNEAWIRLPYVSSNTAYTDSDGNSGAVPNGFSITIINDLIDCNVFIVPYRSSSSSTYVFSIRDANGNYNEYFEMQGTENKITKFIKISAYSPYSVVWFADKDT